MSNATAISIPHAKIIEVNTGVQSTSTDSVLDFSGIQIGEAYTEEDMLDIKSEQAAEPIKDPADIIRLRDYLLANGYYRDYMLFIVAINTGLRYSDFSRLRFVNFIDPEKIGTADPFYKELIIEERKTKNTKKQRVNRHIAINNAIKVAISTYLEHTPNVQLGDYMFTGQSNNTINTSNPMACRSIERNFKRYAAAIGLDINFGTHTFRKTMGYHFMLSSGNSARALLQLQQMYNHSSQTITLRYIGLTADEIRDSYNGLNLGL